MGAPVPTVDFGFPRSWEAEVLAARPAILPARHFVYPRDAEEVERGALEVLVRPTAAHERNEIEFSAVPPIRRKDGEWMGHGDLSECPAEPARDVRPFLATCALGFRDPVVPNGIWATPHPDWLCAVSGGYAYLIDTAAPERFAMIPLRPVLEVKALADAGLLLFVGHRSVLAWSRDGQAWDSEKLSDEGLTITGIEDGLMRGLGWEMRTDKETPFALDLRTGLRVS